MPDTFIDEFNPEKLYHIEVSIRKMVGKLHKKTSLKVLWEVYRLTNEPNPYTAKSNFISNLPIEGIGTKFTDKYFVPPWQIEQAANIIAIYASDYSKKGYIDFQNWVQISKLFNLIYEYNNEISKVVLEDKSVFITLAQIGSQQMHWQDGSLGLDAMSRFSYLYSGEECNKICIEKYGISAVDFYSYGFLLVAQFHSNPIIQLPYDLSIIGGSNETLKIALKQFSLPISDLRSKTSSMRMEDKIGEYSKSIFRQYPILKENQFQYFCINPAFLILRITSGLISEISGDNGNVRNEVGRRFEKYLQLLLDSSFTENSISAEETYGPRRAKNNTPDLRVYDAEKKLSIIFECKSTRLNFESKFDPEKLENLPDRSDEIIKGFTQVWRYVDHCNNKTGLDLLSDNVMGVVVTLEPWIQLNEGRYEKIIQLAHERADRMKLSKNCRIKVVLASIGELEYILQRVTFRNFQELLLKAENPKFNGYMLQNIFSSNNADSKIINKFDNEEILSENIWYWKAVRNARAKTG